MINQREIIKEVVKNIGLLDDYKISRALNEQLNTKERLVKIMIKLGYLANENAGSALISQASILPVEIKIEDIDLKITNSISPQFAISHRVIPFKLQGKTLFLATDDPINLLAVDFFEKTTSFSVDMTLASQDDVDRALVKIYASKQKSIKSAKNDEDETIIKLVNTLIEDALKRRASKIFSFFFNEVETRLISLV